MDSSRFRYVEPEEYADLRTVITDAQEWKPEGVIVDSIGELLPLCGANSNNPDDFTAVDAKVLKPLAKVGSCVIIIDHLAKNPDSRAQGATGTAAKRRAIGGVSYRVKAIEAFAPDQGGRALLLINKDRHGGVRATSPRASKGETVAGTFKLSAPGDYLNDGELSWYIAAPRAGETDPDETAEPELVEALERVDPPPTSRDDARNRLKVSLDRATKAYREWKAKQDNRTEIATTESRPTE